MVIYAYSIGGYWWLNYRRLLAVILLLTIDDYQWLLMPILLMANNGYSIGGY